MKATGQRRWVAGLAVAIGFAGLHHSEAAARGGPRPAFTIHLRNYAGVPSGTLAEAKQVANAIFQRAGVETRWAETDVREAYVQRARVQEQPMTLADIQVNVFPDGAPIPAGVSDGVMGVAPGAGADRTVVDVFDGRVRVLFWKISSAFLKGDTDRPVSEGQLLGHVIAHEVGHLLLNQQGHSPRGIMRGEWIFADFRDMTSGLLLFTPAQAEILREEVARRNVHEPPADVAAAAPSSTSRWSHGMEPQR
jgi:hypothetical protein